MNNNFDIDEYIHRKYYRRVPEFYKDMYKDGFTPQEILYACRRKMIKDYRERQEKQPVINLEVKVKK